MSRPNRLAINPTMKYAKNTSTKPTMPPIIVLLADSTFALSPPDMIHFMPPQTRKRTAMITAITTRTVITLLTTLPKSPELILQILLVNPDGQGLTLVANAGSANVSEAISPVVVVISFFILECR